MLWCMLVLLCPSWTHLTTQRFISWIVSELKIGTPWDGFVISNRTVVNWLPINRLSTESEWKWVSEIYGFVKGYTLFSITIVNFDSVQGIYITNELFCFHCNDVLMSASISNHQHLDCLLNFLFRHRSKKISKLRVTGLCVGNSLVTSEFPAQKASYKENVSIW